MNAAKGNGLDAINDQPAKILTHNDIDFIAKPVGFKGTDNPRHLRIIQALKTRPLPRKHVDQIAGASNGPELIAELRRRGLEVPCTRTHTKDRDLFDSFPGVYHLTATDLRRINKWLAERQQEATHVVNNPALMIETMARDMAERRGSK